MIVSQRIRLAGWSAGVVMGLLTLPALIAQQAPAHIPETDSSYIDAQGTAHVTRVVPVPKTVSPEAQRFLARQVPDTPPAQTMAQIRVAAAAFQDSGGRAAQAIYPVKMRTDTIAGVPVRIVEPLSTPPEKRGRVLINVHGGGFTGD